MSSQPFKHCESFMHRDAKNYLASWLSTATDDGVTYSYPLRDGDTLAWQPNGEPVFVEYPFTIEGHGHCPAWDECPPFCISPDVDVFTVPTYDDCVASGYQPCVVADIALRHKGGIGAVIEVVNKNPLSLKNIEKYLEIGVTEIYTVEAMWVTAQVKQPESLLLERHRITRYPIPLKYLQLAEVIGAAIDDLRSTNCGNGSVTTPGYNRAELDRAWRRIQGHFPDMSGSPYEGGLWIELGPDHEIPEDFY
jgi:hypothetical protein